MHNNDPGLIGWNEWDWRPLARTAVWLAMVTTRAALGGALSPTALARLVNELALGWLLSFGLLTYLQILVATATLRLALMADDLAYGCAERVVRIFMPRASFAQTFAVAFSLELAAILLMLRLAMVLT